MLKIPGVNVYEAARSGTLPPATTAEDLITTVNKIGESALYFATKGCKLTALKDGVTAEQLTRASATDGQTALHYAHECPEQVKGGVTAEQLKAAKNPKGRTALHAWAHKGKILFVSGGVTYQDLLVADETGVTALQELLRVASYINPLPLACVKGGVTADQLAESQQPPNENLLATAIMMNLGNQIKGGVTAERLMGVAHMDATALHTYVQSHQLFQLSEDVTVEQLMRCKDRKGFSALYTVIDASRATFFPDITQFHLAADKQPDGSTSLHLLASKKQLHTLCRGVSKAHLKLTLNKNGKPALAFANADDLLIAESKFDGVFVGIPHCSYDPFNL
jgi:hypothetical protein